jgi:NMD protein affecting ribosome stability and mRNA decay
MKTTTPARQSRHEQRHEQRRAAPPDPYAERRKPSGPAACADCGAVFYRGRWSWRAAPAHARRALCPACRRIRERMPAGFVRLTGAFAREKREALLKLARRCESVERKEHPLQKIMGVEASGEGLLVTTTDGHLARRIGEALHRAHRGELRYRYAPGSRVLRVSWSR